MGALGFPQGKAEPLESFNEQLRDLHESGGWRKIVKPFEFPEDNLPPPGLTTENVCAG